jgi:hypothetical protein
MTLKDRKVIQRMVNNDGMIEGQQANTIWQYTGHGKTLYAVFMTADHDMYTSPYVENPILLWSKDEGKLQDPT